MTDVAAALILLGAFALVFVVEAAWTYAHRDRGVEPLGPDARRRLNENYPPESGG